MSKKSSVLFLCLSAFLVGCGSPATVTSLIRVKRATPNPNSPHQESEAEYIAYKSTQATLLKAPFVLNAALKKPGITQLAIFENQQNISSWLESNLAVESLDDSEIIRVKLSSTHAEDAIKVVDAVVEAYLGEIIQSEMIEQSEQLQTLQTQIQESKPLEKIRVQQIQPATNSQSVTSVDE